MSTPIFHFLVYLYMAQAYNCLFTPVSHLGKSLLLESLDLWFASGLLKIARDPGQLQAQTIRIIVLN